MREISAMEFCYSQVIAFKFHRNFTYVSETYDELYIEHHGLCRFFLILQILGYGGLEVP